MRLGSWQDKGGFVHGPSKRLVGFPTAIAASLSGLAVVALDGATKGTVKTLAVKGSVPEGSVEATAYDAASDRFVLLVRGVRPPRIDLATVTLGATDATFTTLAAENPPKHDGSYFDAILPVGGGVTAIRQSGERYSVTIAGGKATWGDAVATPLTMLPKVAVVDGTRGRRVAFGSDEYDPAAQRVVYRAKIYEQPFASSTWSEIAMGGSPPPDDPTGNGGIVTPWAALDEAGNRLVVVQLHPSSSPPPPGVPGPFLIRGLWVADLGTRQWTKLADSYNGVNGYTWPAPFAVDVEGRRAFTVQGQSLVATALGPTGTGNDTTIALDGALAPRFPIAAAALDGGRVVVTASSGEILVWTGGAGGRFETFAAARVPSEITSNHLLARDPASGKVFLYGGSRTFSDPPVSQLHEVAVDGKTIVRREQTNAPPPRVAFGAAASGGAVYLVGGVAGGVGPGQGTALDDVWSLDLASASWKKVATLPEARAKPAVSVLPDGRLLVVGGYRPSGNDAAGVSSLVTVEPKSGAVTTVTVDGDWPHRKGIFWASAPLGLGVVGIDSGDTVDGSDKPLWELALDPGGHARWTGYDVRSTDWAFHETVGAIGAAEKRAVILGRNVWEITH
jgi:hypothetical protein